MNPKPTPTVEPDRTEIPNPEPPTTPAPETEAPEAGVEPAPETEAPETESAPETEAPEAEPAPEAPSPEAILRDRLLRLQADFDNYRKRQARDWEDQVRQSNATLLKDLLPALDHVDQALLSIRQTTGEDEDNPYLKGFLLVQRSLLDALARHGLKPLESTVDKPLDPETTEALSILKTGAHKPGCVAIEMRRAYELNGKLLRTAQAVVEAEEA